MASSQMVNGSPLFDLTAFQRDLLAVVNDNPGAMGLTIKEALEAVYGVEVNHGRLYPNLNDLHGQGLVSKGKKDDRTNTYELTERGRRELRAQVVWDLEMAGDLLDGDDPRD